MDPDEAVGVVGYVEGEGGDQVSVGRQGGYVHLESGGEGREPFEVWLAPDAARGLAALLERAAGPAPG